MTISFSNNKQSIRNLPHKWKKQYIIYTKDPRKEIWNSLLHFTSFEYLNKFLSDRINDSQIDQIVRFNVKDNTHVKVPAVSDIKEKIPLLRNLINQSFEVYNASINLPLLSRPILLFYSFETLAQFLFRSTYEINQESRYSHGLAYRTEDHTVKVQKEGLFQDFHISHSCGGMDPHTFSFEEILNCGSINPVELELYSGRSFRHILKNTNGEQVSITELDRELIFIFSISILARYKILEWSNILDGIRSDKLDVNVGIFIRRYIQAIELTFPILILNELKRMSCFFYEPARMMADEWEKYDDKII
ncbi:MAG: YaaC family protein [Candidatus Nitrosocosmicus sp.]|nr:YaaC family protein [Candidatus Nitrosocosmicus sp.]